MKYCFLFFTLAVAAWGQWSGSGSNGSDGALTLDANTPGVVNGTLVFDPVALKLDTDGDNVYHFTTININGITVQFKANKMRHTGPVIFLASGAVTIQGRLDLSGEAGHPIDSNESVRRPSVPGPGGYPGGAGARVGGTPMIGLGPGGGKIAAPASWGCPAAFVTNVTASWCTAVGASAVYGNTLLQPLVGGSGGSGGLTQGQTFGGGGGAGGGAIRISSSSYIAFGSGINANGSVIACSDQFWISSQGGSGGSGRGGPGSGGAVHLQAPFISGCTTHIYVAGGGQSDFGNASSGRIRFDANSVVSVATNGASPLSGPLVDVPLPAFARIRIVSINGVAAPTNPNFDYTTPDLSTTASGSVPVIIAASNIPVATPVTVFLTSEGGADVASSQVTLNGTVASSTATINVALPQGVTRLLARAVW